MRKLDIGAGAIFIVLSVPVLLQSLQLDFYVEGVPGPGFFPSVLAIVLALTGAILILSRIGRPDDAFPKFDKPSRPEAQRTLVMWLAILASVLLSSVVGFLIAMFLLVAAIILGLERRRGLGPIATVVLTPLFAYWLFGILLQVPLPAGVFGE